MLLALAIFGVSLILVVVRPKPLNEAAAASLGAFVMLVAGVVTPMQGLDVLRSTANILLFFVGLMAVSAVADRAGFFEWGALKAVRLAGGNGHKLLLVVFLLGAAVTAFFSNDATALVLTPIVYMLATRLRLDPLPFVFACAFVANTASILLPISNPVNLLAVDRFGIGLGEYLRFMIVPAVLALALNIGLFALVFRKSISRTFPVPEFPNTGKVDPFFRFVCAGLGLTAAGYLVALVYRWPAAIPALGGAAFLMSGSLAFGRIRPRALGSGIQWSILAFIFSLAVLVKGLDNAGVTRMLGEAIAGLAGKDPFTGVAAMTFLTAAGSNLINNWSMMMVSVSSLAVISNPVPLFDRSLIFSAIVGADLGPNLTIIGSLSSMLWLVILRRRGLNIHPLQYLKLGLLVTPPMLLAAALGISAAR